MAVAAALVKEDRYLRPRVCVLGRIGLAGGEIDRVVPAAPLDLVLVPEPAVEPDRAVEGPDLVDQHVAQLGLERVGVRGGREVAAHLLAGGAQRMRDAADELANRLLRAAPGRNACL